ncbi:Replication factor C subunit [Sesamum angolense]|uniref:Replication factor C subunit n=1 Tax=Sesamum angolense TaxID=2727404 RepID=A0AAE1XFT8_9LAMI|nr:Replication factor C subunit [Sesamum angolense]
MCHFIFEGNPGVGKRTMIGAFLREAFGEDKVQGEALGSIHVNLKVSTQHVEVNLSELKGYEKHVIVELIKEKNQTSDTTLECNEENCKAIVLHEADKLSTDALSYIKWMLEKFKGCNKVFFCCNDAKKLQEIKPLCTYVQLLEPSIEEILHVLSFIATQGIQLPHELAYKIANNSKNNLRQAIRSFEATWHFNTTLTEDQDIKTGWEDKIANIARNVLEEQSPKQLYNIRGELQTLIEHNVAPEFIFQTLKEELEKILPDQLQPQFDHLYEEYQKNRANKNHCSSAHQQEELGNRQNDQKKNVQQFMRIEDDVVYANFLYSIHRVYSKIHELVQGLRYKEQGFLTRSYPGRLLDGCPKRNAFCIKLMQHCLQFHSAKWYFLESLENDTQCSTSLSTQFHGVVLPLMLDNIYGIDQTIKLIDGNLVNKASKSSSLLQNHCALSANSQADPGKNDLANCNALLSSDIPSLAPAITPVHGCMLFPSHSDRV